jgi:glucose/arabinose dehydrogenase
MMDRAHNRSLSRRQYLALAVTTGSLGLAGCRQSDRAAANSEAIGVETIASGFTSPVDFAMPPDDDRMCVVDQPGQIHVVDAGTVRDELFLDLESNLVSLSGYDERGLLGFAFHPDFTTNGRCFARYSAPPRDGTPDGFEHTFVLAEFQADPERLVADPASERSILEIPEPQSNHNAGAITFGPDGFLYVAVGDGGASNDTGLGHVSDWYAAVPGGNGQDVTQNLLGSILRLDVDETGSDRQYGIPETNPLVGRAGRDEHFAWGFRNPWGMSFAGDELFVADVGQRRYEEINLVTNGGNYGWNVREGAHCFNPGSNDGSEACPTAAPSGEPLVDPIIEYPHQSSTGPSGSAVIGGYLYQGSLLPSLRDSYVFADWQARGTLFIADRPTTSDAQWPISRRSVEPVGPSTFGTHVLSFGRGNDDELYVLTTDNATISGETGRLQKLVAPPAETSPQAGD